MTDEQKLDHIAWWADAYERQGGHAVVVGLLREYRAIIAASASAQPACVECGGPLQWRCPSCRIAQSAAVADPPPQSTAAGAQPVAWMTLESLNRLRHGGNNSRGSVPVHAKTSKVATIPLYTTPPQSTADTVRVPREPTVTMIKAGSHYAHPEGIWAAMIVAAPKDTTP